MKIGTDSLFYRALVEAARKIRKIEGVRHFEMSAPYVDGTIGISYSVESSQLSAGDKYGFRIWNEIIEEMLSTYSAEDIYNYLLNELKTNAAINIGFNLAPIGKFKPDYIDYDNGKFKAFVLDTVESDLALSAFVLELDDFDVFSGTIEDVTQRANEAIAVAISKVDTEAVRKAYKRVEKFFGTDDAFWEFGIFNIEINGQEVALFDASGLDNFAGKNEDEIFASLIKSVAANFDCKFLVERIKSLAERLAESKDLSCKNLDDIRFAQTILQVALKAHEFVSSC